MPGVRLVRTLAEVRGGAVSRGWPPCYALDF